MLTKSQEIEIWRSFVANLQPGSYLDAMFAGSEEKIAGMIRNDFAYSPIDELNQARAELRGEVVELQQSVAVLVKKKVAEQAELARLEKQADIAQDRLEKIREQAKLLAQM